MSEPPLIDRGTLDELLESIGRDGVRSVIELFIGESRAYLATIAAAVAAPADAGRRDQARRAAHSLKSGAAQIGAAAMSLAAAAVEHAAAAGSADFPQRVDILEDCAKETVGALGDLG